MMSTSFLPSLFDCLSVSSKRITYISLNQWFDKSLLIEINLQPIYFPSINKENYENFIQKGDKNFEKRR